MASWQFQHGREFYAQLFGVSPRTISRWAKSGIPLDDERQTRLLIATGTKSAPEQRANAPQTASTAPAGALGLSPAIGRLQAAEEAAHSEYIQANAGGGQILASAKQKQWLAFTEQLRKLEQTTPDVEEANRNSVRIEEVQAALNDLFLKLRQDLDSFPKRVALEVAGRDEISAREILTREIGEVISALYSCKYLGELGAE